MPHWVPSGCPPSLSWLFELTGPLTGTHVAPTHCLATDSQARSDLWNWSCSTAAGFRVARLGAGAGERASFNDEDAAVLGHRPFSRLERSGSWRWQNGMEEEDAESPSWNESIDAAGERVEEKSSLL